MVAALLALVMLGAGSLFLREPAQTPRDRTGLFTSLPILWNESANLADMLAPDAAPHWAKALLEAGGVVVPLDVLATPDGSSKLTGLRYLVMAQPRPLSPQENVAIDAWVRGGGRLLLFADPMLTEETAFALGDKRRPQDVVLLDPLLDHWGLQLEFDSASEAKGGSTQAMGMAIPVNLPGRLIAKSGQCRAWGQGDLATCRIGKGRVLVLADAAVLERDDPEGSRAKALKLLLEAAFTGGDS